MIRIRGVSQYFLAVLDVTCIVMSYVFAIHYAAELDVSVPYDAINFLPYLLIVIVVWFASAIERRLWSTRVQQDFVSYLIAVTKAMGTATIICVFGTALFTPEGLNRDFLVAFCFTSLVLLLVTRSGVLGLLGVMRRMGTNLRRCVIVGANDRTKALIQSLREHEYFGFAIVGVLDDDPDREGELAESGIRYLGPVNNLSTVAAREGVEEVYVSLPVRSHYETVQSITRYCEDAGIHAHLLADFFPVKVARSRLMHIEDIPLLSLSTIPEAYAKLALKRFVDFVGSTVLILLLGPLVMLPIALAVKFTSKGPILFPQERVGQNQRRFKMLKFRSMVQNAEALRAELEAQNEADGPVFKIKKDPRVTPVGRFIRKYSLDELPQLFNVWIGEMSLVGPRPPIPGEVEEYSWHERRRLSVKPGMTGLWQVSGRSDVGFEEWVQMDLAYIDNWSLWQDFVILLRTFGAVIAGRGAA